MTIVEILAQARALTPDEEKKLQELLQQRDALKQSEPSRSLFELRGLGKEVWQGIDIDAYINEMRNEWDRDR